MRVLDLFSGIGGFSLGLERAGMTTVAFCEIDPFARAVLRKNWPDVPIHDDIRQLDGRAYRPDVVCGGFPCQDISEAKQGAEGLAGDRSGLWFEMQRIIEECRPRFVIAENSTRLRRLGLDVMLRFFASLGYDAEWHCLTARSFNAPHERDRLYVVAYPHGFPEIGPAIARQERPAWPGEPALPRVANGVRNQPHRRRVLGNAVVPRIPEAIGRAILAAEETVM